MLDMRADARLGRALCRSFGDILCDALVMLFFHRRCGEDRRRATICVRCRQALIYLQRIDHDFSKSVELVQVVDGIELHQRLAQDRDDFLECVAVRSRQHLRFKWNHRDPAVDVALNRRRRDIVPEQQAHQFLGIRCGADGEGRGLSHWPRVCIGAPDLLARSGGCRKGWVLLVSLDRNPGARTVRRQRRAPTSFWSRGFVFALDVVVNAAIARWRKLRHWQIGGAFLNAGELDESPTPSLSGF